MGGALGLGAGLSPGPLLALVMAESLRGGRREGVKVALSPLLTDPPIIAGTLWSYRHFELLRPLLGWLGIAGALLVAHLGYELLRLPSCPHPPPPDGLRRGVAVNLLNPHPYLFWLTVGGPLLAGRGTLEALCFLLGFYAALVGSKVAVALTGEALLRERVRSPVLRSLGVAMLVLAALLARRSASMLCS